MSSGISDNDITYIDKLEIGKVTDESINMNSYSLAVTEGLKEEILSIQINSDYTIVVYTIKGNIINNIVFKNLDNRKLIDWEKTQIKVKTSLKELALPTFTVNGVCRILNNNYNEISKFIDNLRNKYDDELKISNNQQKKQRVKVFKYYSERDLTLYESVALGETAYFVFSLNGQANYIESIEDGSRTLIPFGSGDGASNPYAFKDIASLNELLDKVKKMSISDIYKITKNIVKKYIDQKPRILNLIATDLIYTYFQDRFPTTHYLFFVGDNGVGKSVIGNLFELLGYRGVKMTDPSPANIYRLLGKVQPAQCTLIMDEVEKIDNNQDLMNILKTGYTIEGKVPKINTNTYEQEFFNTFSFKVFLSERLPSNYIAKGVLDRTFSITCLIGTPKYNLKDVLVSHGKQGNRFVKELRQEIEDLRKLLFAYRLLNAYNDIPDIDVGLKNRDKELSEGLALFFGTEVQEEVVDTFQYFIDSKYEQKRNTFESYLLGILLHKLSESKDGRSVSIQELWNAIERSTNCNSIKQDQMYLQDFGMNLYYNQLTAKCKVFGAETKHTSKGNVLYFKEVEKLKQHYAQYQQKPIIKCSLIYHEKDEGDEGNEGSERRLMSLVDNRNEDLVQCKPFNN